MSAKIWALVMTALAVVYVLLLGQKAILLMLDADFVAKAMGLALLVLPLVAAWAILTEVKFGIDAEKLAKANSLPQLQLELRPVAAPPRPVLNSNSSASRAWSPKIWRIGSFGFGWGSAMTPRVIANWPANRFARPSS